MADGPWAASSLGRAPIYCVLRSSGERARVLIECSLQPQNTAQFVVECFSFTFVRCIVARKVSTSFLLSQTVYNFYIFHFPLVRLVTTPPVGVWSMGYGCAPQPSHGHSLRDPSPVLLCRHQPALAPSRCVVLADNGGAGSGLWRMRGKQAKNSHSVLSASPHEIPFTSAARRRKHRPLPKQALPLSQLVSHRSDSVWTLTPRQSQQSGWRR